MRKTLCLVFLGCALVVGLACSGDSTTPTAPATTGLESVTAASADKVYLCHTQRNQWPLGVIVEVSQETIKRHYKHLANNYDCRCTDSATAGLECTWSDGSGDSCNTACPD